MLGNDNVVAVWYRALTLQFLSCQRAAMNHVQLVGLWQESGHKRGKPGKEKSGRERCRLVSQSCHSTVSCFQGSNG